MIEVTTTYQLNGMSKKAISMFVECEKLRIDRQGIFLMATWYAFDNTAFIPFENSFSVPPGTHAICISYNINLPQFYS